MRWVHRNFDVENRGQPAEALRANAQRVYFFVELDAQFFGFVLRAALEQIVHVDGFHQHLFGHQHCFLCGATNSYAQHARRTPAGAHCRHGFEHPIHERIARVEHHEFGFVLAATTFGRNIHIDGIAGH